MNRTEIIGNLAQDPVLRNVNGPDGTPMRVCNFNVAVNENYRNNPNVVYYSVSVWNQLADICAQYLQKGRKVFCSGTVRPNLYQAQDGTWKASLVLNAQSVEFLTPAPQNGDQPPVNTGAAAPAARRPVAQPAAPATQPQPNYGVGQQPDPNNGFQPVETDELPF